MLLFNLVVAFLLTPLVLAQDYYAILGVGKDAGDKEIKSAYRQLSKKYHPDKNPGDEDAHHKFIEVGEAYEVLSDSEKRQIYDRHGADALKNGGATGGQGGGFHDPFDMFEKMFGGGRGGFGGARGKPKGQTLKVNYELGLKEYYSGVDLAFSLELNDICDSCEGTGSADRKLETCPHCKGTGIVVQIIRHGMMQQRIQQHCPKCQGKGTIIKNPCKKCHGNKVVRKMKEFKAHVEPGFKRNHVVILQGEAEKHPDVEPGDLYIALSENAQNNLGYRRRGNHLYRTEVISLKEALQGGWSRDIDFLDQQKHVHISRKSGQTIQNGELEKITGFGMPIFDSPGKFGDLFIDYKIIVPEKISPTIFDDEL